MSVEMYEYFGDAFWSKQDMGKTATRCCLRDGLSSPPIGMRYIKKSTLPGVNKAIFQGISIKNWCRKSCPMLIASSTKSWPKYVMRVHGQRNVALKS